MAGNVIRATLIADSRQFKSGFKDAEKATDSFGSKLGNTASLAKGLLAGAAATAVIGFAGDAISAFSDLEQATGSVESVFGSAADQIITKSQNAADEFGLSTAEMQQASALLGSQLKNQLGLDVDEAASKTTDLIGTASDLAAQFGGSTSDAVSALSSLMRGERDPIEKYGVSMNDAMIQAKALEMGLADSTGEVTAQAKAAASLQIVYEQTGDAAGAFGREADTVAGKLQRSKAKITDLKAEIGKGLAPAFGLAMDAAAALEPVVKSLTTALEGATTATQPLVDELTALIGVGPEAGIGLQDVGGALAHTILPFLGPITMGIHNINELLGRNAEKNREAVRGMEDTRDHGLAYLEEGVKELSDAEQEALNISEGVTKARLELSEQAVETAQDEATEIADAYRSLTGESRRSFEAQAAEVEEFLTGFEAAPDRIDMTLQEWFDTYMANLAEMEQWKADMKTLSDAGLDAFVDEMVRQGPAARGVVAEAVALHKEDPAAARLLNQQVAMGEASMLAIGQGMKGKAPTIASQSVAAIERAMTGKTVNPSIDVSPQYRFRGRNERQRGGPVRGGTPYLVGESGPEVVVPAGNGRVIPNNQLRTSPAAGGGPTIVNNITMHLHAGLGTDPNALAKAVYEALQRYQRMNGPLALDVRMN